MDDGRLGALQRFKGAADQFLARLGENLDGDALGNLLVLDEKAHEIKIRLRGGGKAHFDFLEAHGKQRENMRILRSCPMGSMSDWLPSRRSTEHQMGALVMVRLGQCRSGKGIWA